MHEQVKQVPGHCWLFGFAIGLTVLSVLHVLAVDTPTAFLNFHLIATAGLWLYAELRRQRWERTQLQGKLTRLVAAAERTDR